MKRAKSWLSYIGQRPYFFGAIALVVLGGAWVVFGKNGETPLETVVVHPSNFTAQISIAGNVTAAREVDMGFTQSGRITGVYAKVGDRVTQGTLLANIENGDLRAALESARAKLSSAEEGTRPEELLIAETDVSSDKSALLVEIRDAYRVADDAVRARTAQLFNNPSSNPTLTFITESLQGKTGAEDGRLELEHTLRTWERELPTLTISSNLESASLKANTILAEAATFLTYASMALNRAETDTITTQADIDAYVADVAVARSNIGSAQTSLATAEANLNASLKNLALKQAGSTKNDIEVERAAVRAAEAELQKTLITAPFTGIVTVMEAKVGKIVSPNTPEVSLISEGAFQIESFIPEVIIAEVMVGNPATVYLDAYGSSEPFSATIIAVDPAETEREGVSTYKTTLQFTQEDPRIRPGMTANITVTTEEKSNTFVLPQGALIRRGEQKFVQVLRNEEVEERMVTTGLTSVGQIEITSGLNDGDVVILNPNS